jgi:hypothetical protein
MEDDLILFENVRQPKKFKDRRQPLKETHNHNYGCGTAPGNLVFSFMQHNL